MSNVIVIGGGAAGMMAAYAAGMCGHSVTLLEKNEKLGKKIYITGKGRCNFTNACSEEDFLKNVVSNPKFLYSAIYTFNSDAMIDFVEMHGTETKVERGNRAFPASDHASDITKALKNALQEVNVDIQLNTSVSKLIASGDRVTGVELKNNKKLIATSHAPKLRYLSSNTGIATVNKAGKITAKKAGICTVYAYAANGVSKAVNVTVK